MEVVAAGAKFGVSPSNGETPECRADQITDHQKELYMIHRKKDRPDAWRRRRRGSARRQCYRIEADPGRPSEKRKPRGRRRPDPLAGIFEEEIVPLLEASPGLRAVALYERDDAPASGAAPRGAADA